MYDFEQGPIRPPSEANSLLVRVSRNCPWNRCAFCPVYKNRKPSRRKVDEVLADLDAMQRVYGDWPQTVFLQDANPLIVRPDDLVRIIEGIRRRFPKVRRITAYARSNTLARRSLEDLQRLRQAGLNRLHVGLESGCDAVLELIAKGVTQAEQIAGGQKAKQAGFELSEYVMPGLGGAELSDCHADDTAAALVQIEPDFIRLRTTAVIPRTPLAELVEQGRFTPCSEVQLVREIRRFLRGLDGVQARLESDHMLNLLMELRGDLPAELDDLIAVCDRFLELPATDRWRFVLARRMGWMGRLADFLRPEVRAELGRRLELPEDADERELERISAELRMRMV
jgi:hypothetical protein